MNHVYRLVWSTVHNAWVAIAENRPSRGKNGGGKAKRLLAATLLLSAASSAFSQSSVLSATALPQGGQVVAGQASISQSAATMTVQQGSQQAILNWQAFNIGSSASVNFQQPNAAAVALNRVIGADASQIMGRLTANGQVFLINPNGIMFSQSASVNVGGMVASTLGVSDSDFLSGNFRFNRNGATGKIENAGSLSSASGGYVALLASDIHNSGIISAQRGTVALAAGEAVTLSMNGGAVQVQVDPAQVQAQIANSNLVEAEGGTVIMNATAANVLLGASINNSGTLSASSLVNDGGTIRLAADHVLNTGTIQADGPQGGRIDISARQHDAFGQMSAQGTQLAGGSVNIDSYRTVMLRDAAINVDGQTDGGRISLASGLSGTGGMYLSGSMTADGNVGQGGEVVVTGSQLDLFGINISAKGGAGGGQIRVGGDYQGSNAAVPNAERLNVNAGTFDVSATQNGRGGQAIFWSEQQTLFAGRVEARGATNGVKVTNTGGLVEVSSRGELGFGGTAQAKQLLLDPSVLNIIEPGMGFEMTNFVDPDAAASGFGTAVYDVSNTNVLVLSPNQNAIGSGAGYVFQRDGTLVSAIRDTGGVTNWNPLGSDRYLIANTSANAGLGAVSYFNSATSTVNGRMDASNSLVGDGTYGQGFGKLYDLGGGYYGATLATDRVGLNSLVLQRGAWHFFKANNASTSLATGIVGSGNSLVGSTAGTAPATDPAPLSGQNTWMATTRGDAIGFFASNDLRNSTNTPDTEPYVSRTLTSIGAGNWVMSSPLWNGNTGAVTIISPSLIDNGTLRGAISASNSILGTATNQNLGLELRNDGRGGTGLLQFGGSSSTNYLLNLTTYGGVGAFVALTPSVATTGIFGALNSSNALLFQAGDAATGVTQLSDGSVVLSNSLWSSNRGYARVLPFNTNFETTLRGQLSAVDVTNSLIGGTTTDKVGQGITDLGSGNFLVRSAYNRSFTKWTGPSGTIDLGALTFMSASAPVVGTLSASNSLLGRTNTSASTGVFALGNVTALSDGTYVVLGRDTSGDLSLGWGFAAYGRAGVGVVGQAGAGAGSVGLYDAVNYSGFNSASVTDLGSGSWVISVPWLTNYNDPYLVWGGSSNIPSGQVTTANTFTLQNPGSANIGSLGGGRFVLGIPNYGANATEGAVTIIDAANATIPTLSSANAMLGNAGDHLGAGVSALGNNRFAILNPNWNGNTGAVTFVDPSNAATRLVGAITTSNSFTGTSAGDGVGSGGIVSVGSSGISALVSQNWGGNKGAVTLFNTATGDLLGSLSGSNSLVGRNAGDHVGVANYGANGSTTDLFVDLGGGEFAMRTAGWLANTGDSSAAGAVTWINTAQTMPTGTVGATNSLVGANAGDVIGADGLGSLLTSLGGGYYAMRHAYFANAKGAMTIFDRAAPAVGSVGTGNSLVNTSTATGVFNAANASFVQLGNGYALMTPMWGNGLEGAITYIPTGTTATGAISSATSLIGAAGNALGGQVMIFTNSANNAQLLIGSPLWNGTRGAATLVSNASGLSNTLKGVLTVDATNSFIGSAVGDKVSSGGFNYLGNDIYVVQSPDFGSGAASRTVFGAVTMGDSVTNALKGDVSSINSFFSSISGQSAAPYISGQGQTGAILSTGSEVGLIQVVQPVSLVNSSLLYSDYGTRRVNMRPLTIEAVLSTGTDLVLQATNAINLYSPITVNNPTGNGGHLTLQTSSSSGAITIGSQGRITTDNGELTIISAGSFINNASAIPFNTGSNRWTVYANDPATSSLGSNLGFGFKEYGKTFGQVLDGRTALGSNVNAVVFAQQPTLSMPSVLDFKTYDGTTALGTPVSITGLVDGDLLDHTFAYTDIHADPNWNSKDIVLTVGNGGLTSSVATGQKPVYGYLNQPAAGFTQTFAGAGFIQPFSLNVDLAGTVSKVYDGTDTAPTGYALQFVVPAWQQAAPDSGLTFDSSQVSGNFYSDPWGWGVPSNTTALVSGHSSGNGAQYFQAGGPIAVTVPNGARYLATDYSIQMNNYYVQGTITPKPVVAGLTASNKTYDGTTTASVTGSLSQITPIQSIYNSTSGASADNVQLAGTATVGSANFVDANAGTGKTVTINLSGLSLTGADAENYTIANTTTTADITPKALTISGSTVTNKQYDGTAAATINVGTLAGFVGSETLVASGAGTFASVNVGNNINVATTYSLANGSNGGLASNYSLASETLTGNITPAWLAVIVGSLTGSSSKVYDGSTAATLSTGNFLLSGWVNGDGADVSVTKTLGVFADKNVGSNKLVTVTLTSGDFAATTTNLSNYGLPTTASGNIGTITAKSLTASYTASNKVYNGNITASVSGSSNDVINGDTVNFTQTANFSDKNVANGKTVNVSSISLSGADAGNYSLQNLTATTTANIIAKALTATFTGSNKVYDRLTTASVAGASSDIVSGDAVSFTQTANFSDKNVANGKTINVSSIGLSGADAGNYVLQNTTATTTANITAKSLSVVYTGNNRAYDGSTLATVNDTITGIISGDTVTLSETASFVSKNAGTSKTVNVSAMTLAGADAGNYVLQNTTATTTASITAKALTASYSGSDKVYDANTSAAVLGSSTDVISGDTVTFTQTADFANKNVGAGKTINVNSIALSGADAGNYALQNVTATTSANIIQATLNVTGATASNKVYDGTSVATVSGGGIAALGSDSLTLSGANASFANKNVGTAKAVTTAYTLSGADAANYALVQASGLAADITAKTVTATYTGVNKVYDAGTSASVTGGLSGGISGDTITYSQTAAFADKNVGTNKQINISGISLGGADAGNYVLANTSSTTSANITPFALSISGITANNKIYDATTNAILSGTASLSGVMGSDVVNVSGTASGAFANKHVGVAKSILVSGLSLSGADAANYTVGALSATADISAKALTASYSGSNKVYDAGVNATVAGSSADIINGDTIGFSQTAVFVDKNVGTAKQIGVSNIALTGADAGNYVLQSTTATTSANITQATLNVTGATAANKVYDASTAASVTGGGVTALGGDSITLSAANATFANKNIGTAKVVTTAYTLSGTDAANYALVQAAGLTANITPASIFVTGATAANRGYDATTIATVTGASVTALGNDSLGLAVGSANFADKNVGAGKAVATSFTLTGADASNYVLSQPSLTADITPKMLTVTGLAASDKTYDANTSVVMTNWGSVSTGIGTETVMLNHGGASFSDANAGNGKTVTASGYSLSDGSNGGLAGNYQLSASTATTNANIAKAVLTMTVQNTSKAFSDIDPTLGATYSGFAGAETSSVLSNVAVTRVAGEAAGNYVITPTATAANYTVTPVTGTFTVAPADQLVIQVSNASMVYGSTITFGVTSAKYYSSTGNALRTLGVSNTNGVFTVDDGLGTTASFSLTATGAGTSSAGLYQAGNHTLTGTGFQVLSGGNFSSSNFSTGNLAVSRLAVDLSDSANTGTLDAGSSTTRHEYDGTTSATLQNLANIDNLVVGDLVTLNTSNAIGGYADAHAGNNKLATFTGVTLDGADANNYSFGGTLLAEGKIDPRTLTWNNIQVANRVYDTTTNATVTNQGSLGNIVGSDQVSLQANSAFAVFQTKDAGVGKQVDVYASLTGAAAADYQLPAGGTAYADIAQANLSVTGVSAINKVYDGTTAATVVGGTLSGVLVGDSVTLGAGNANFADKHVGTAKTVTTAYTLSGTDAANYSLAQASGLSANVTAKPLQVAYLGRDKVYDGSTLAHVAGNSSDIIVGDAVAFTQIANFANPNVGTAVTINVTSIALSGSDAGNYSLQNASASTSADITPPTSNPVNSTSNLVSLIGGQLATGGGSGGNVSSANSVSASGNMAQAGSITHSSALMVNALVSGGTAYTPQSGGATVGAAQIIAGLGASSLSVHVGDVGNGFSPVMIQNVTENQGFISVDPIRPIRVASGQSAVFEVSRGVFHHSDDSAVLRLEARQADGAPLPNWMSFNSVSGILSMQSPVGIVSEVRIVVTAFDGFGNTALASMEIVVK
ncbi:MAG: YDG domain-containing protein [Gallionella sp.]|nr:YDG domain-containing protein [Gallionella sp.]